MRILNLYAGIGGNRKLWGNEHDITAVEINPDIANIYRDFFPGDKVIVADAHQYLLEHFKEFDFIWSSPPCPSHSDIRRCAVHAGRYGAIYPEMSLYQEIILLKHFALKTTQYAIENVIPYYKPLIEGQKIERHLFWSNFNIAPFKNQNRRRHQDIVGSSNVYGFTISKYRIKNKRKILRNCVNPELGKHVLDYVKKSL
ncbi:MAG: class I SAM-dependent methyltransferase [Eubacteriales bacterium]